MSRYTNAELAAMLPDLPVPCVKSVRALPRRADEIKVYVQYAVPGWAFDEFVAEPGCMAAIFSEEKCRAWWPEQMKQAGDRALAAYNEFAGDAGLT